MAEMKELKYARLAEFRWRLENWDVDDFEECEALASAIAAFMDSIRGLARRTHPRWDGAIYYDALNHEWLAVRVAKLVKLRSILADWIDRGQARLDRIDLGEGAVECYVFDPLLFR